MGGAVGSGVGIFDGANVVGGKLGLTVGPGVGGEVGSTVGPGVGGEDG